MKKESEITNNIDEGKMLNISSPGTEGFKRYSFFVACIPFKIMLLMMFISPNELSFKAIITPFILFCIFALPIYFWAKKLKKVTVDSNYLVVSDFHGEIKISLLEIEDVYQGILGKFFPETVLIILKKETCFGKKIQFIPETRFFGFMEHPIVEQLETLKKNCVMNNKQLEKN